MAKISRLHNVVAIKEASASMAQIQKCLAITDADVYCGDDGLTATSMCVGAKGVISVAANVAPALMSRLTGMALVGNLAKAGSLQLKLLPLIDALFAEVNPIPVRAALNLMGINTGAPRLPMTELTDENKTKLKRIMEELKLI